jgi:hypothetical protein
VFYQGAKVNYQSFNLTLPPTVLLFHIFLSHSESSNRVSRSDPRFILKAVSICSLFDRMLFNLSTFECESALSWLRSERGHVTAGQISTRKPERKDITCKFSSCVNFCWKELKHCESRSCERSRLKWADSCEVLNMSSFARKRYAYKGRHRSPFGPMSQQTYY